MNSLNALILLLLLTLAGCTPAGVPRPDAEDDEGVSEDGKPKATGRELAYQWHRLRLIDENGEIAPGAFERSIEQRQAMIAAQANGPIGDRDAGLSRPLWVSRGPDNLGGRTCSLSIDPRDSNKLIAGSVGGGIWRSTNAGATWSKIDDYMPSLAIGSLERDPSNPDVIYAGSGEGFFNGDSIGGYGIFKSTDNGLTWTLIPSTASWDKVNAISVHPQNSNTILASRNGGISRTIDGGTTWTTVRGARGSHFVQFDPIDPRKAVASVIEWTGTDWIHRAIWSSNFGASWTTSTGSLAGALGFGSRIELAIYRGNTNIVYASTGLDGKIHKSTDGGHSYAPVTTSGTTGAFGYCSPIWVSPTDPNFIVVGGGQPAKSTDGGLTITQISNGYILTDAPHPDIHHFVADPGYNGTTNKKFWICTDGGPAYTPDITTATDLGWTRKYNTYRTTQFYGAAGHGPTGRLIGGTQDNGTLVLDIGSDIARLPYGGDGGFCAIDHVDPNYMYGEFIYLTVYRSTNGGNSASNIVSGLTDTGSSATANFIAPLVLDPLNHNILYGGGRSLWRTRNARSNTTWSSIKPAGTDNISAIAISPSDNRHVWIGQNNGEIYRTTTASSTAPTWITVDNNTPTPPTTQINPLPNRYVSRILIDPDNVNTVYVALGGFATNNLWKTTDAGATWTLIVGTPNAPTALPSVPIYGIARHPQNPQWLYVATEMGVYASGDGGLHWSTDNEGPANTRVDEITFLTGGSTVLLAATYGRGLFTANIRPCPADFNHDGAVDFFDYDDFVLCFEGLACPPGLTADFNHDGAVDFFDYDDFVVAFEMGC